MLAMRRSEAATLLVGIQMLRCRSRRVGMKRVGLLRGLGARRYFEMSIIMWPLVSWSVNVLPSSCTHIGHLEVFTVQRDGGMNEIA